MADYEYTNTSAKSLDAPEEGQGTYTLTFDGQQRTLLLMALGELLASVTRSEHLTLAIQALIARVESAPATAARGAREPTPQNRTDAGD